METVRVIICTSAGSYEERRARCYSADAWFVVDIYIKGTAQ